MNWDDLFGLASSAALAGWVVLILGPRRFGWLNLIPRLVLPLGLAVVYSGLMLAFVFQTGGGFGSIAEVRQLFSSDPVLTAGWVHYLAFDLIVGGMIADRLDAAGVNRVIQAPILGATFLLGPLGLLLGLATQTGARLRQKAV